MNVQASATTHLSFKACTAESRALVAGRISFGEAQLSDANLAKRFKVKKAPHLVIQLGDKESVAHKGKFDHYEIWKFMNSCVRLSLNHAA